MNPLLRAMVMGSRIVHYGQDLCFRLPVLASSGYVIDACGTLLSKLNDNLRQSDIDAVAVSEDGAPADVDVVAITRSQTAVPLILFEGVDRKFDPFQFDVAIPPTAPIEDWLAIIAHTIHQSRAIMAEARLLYQQSAALRRESVVARQNAREERVRSKRQHSAMQEPSIESDGASEPT